jgi:phage virion morphogenesis protein
MRLDLRAVGNRSVLAALRDIRQVVSNRAPMMEAIGAKLESNVNMRFDTKRDPSGTPWAPHRESTAAWYAMQDTDREGMHRRAGTVLERTRMMRMSLGHDSGNDFAAIGFGMPYAIFHELGTKRMVRRGMLTADPVAGTLGDQDERDVLDIVESYFSRAK